MKTHAIHISQVHVSSQPVMYTCYGLGSCIGLFVVDRVMKISGVAHIPLPSESGGDWVDSTGLIKLLLDNFCKHGSNLKTLRAKITGGAKIIESSSNIGELNTIAVYRQLIKNRIFVAASDVGGQVSRTARFNSETGDLEISVPGKIMYRI